MSIYRGSSALRQEHELAVVEEGEPDLGRRQGLGSADAAVRPGQGAAEGARDRDVMKPVAGPQSVSSDREVLAQWHSLNEFLPFT